MKALTLTQPWASLMELQAKTIETRSWRTSYRGELVIHAAKSFPKEDRLLCERDPFRRALRGASANNLPLSKGLCVVRLVACIPTDKLHGIELARGVKPSADELHFGNYGPGRYAWVTEFVRTLYDDRVVRGALSLWDWPAIPEEVRL